MSPTRQPEISPIRAAVHAAKMTTSPQPRYSSWEAATSASASVTSVSQSGRARARGSRVFNSSPRKARSMYASPYSASFRVASDGDSPASAASMMDWSHSCASSSSALPSDRDRRRFVAGSNQRTHARYEYQALARRGDRMSSHWCSADALRDRGELMIDDDSSAAFGSQSVVSAAPRTPCGERSVARVRRAEAQELEP